MKRTTKQVSLEKSSGVISDLLAFMRLTLKLGVLDRERREFWRFFMQALASHREKFVEAMRLAAVGYHFRKLNDAYGK